VVFHLIFAAPSLLVVVRWLWPLSLPLWTTAAVALVSLSARAPRSSRICRPASSTMAPNAQLNRTTTAQGLLAAFGVANALRVPPVKDLDVAIRDLPPAFEGYRHRPVDEVAGHDDEVGPRGIGAIDHGPDPGRREAPDGVFAVPGNHEYFFDYAAWMRHLAGLGIRLLEKSRRSRR
jgi:hypothetical protein